MKLHHPEVEDRLIECQNGTVKLWNLFSLHDFAVDQLIHCLKVGLAKSGAIANKPKQRFWNRRSGVSCRWESTGPCVRNTPQSFRLNEIPHRYSGTTTSEWPRSIPKSPKSPPLNIFLVRMRRPPQRQALLVPVIFSLPRFYLLHFVVIFEPTKPVECGFIFVVDFASSSWAHHFPQFIFWSPNSSLWFPLRLSFLLLRKNTLHDSFVLFSSPAFVNWIN